MKKEQIESDYTNYITMVTKLFFFFLKKKNLYRKYRKNVIMFNARGDFRIDCGFKGIDCTDIDFINKGFSWGLSQEGFEFWEELHSEWLDVRELFADYYTQKYRLKYKLLHDGSFYKSNFISIIFPEGIMFKNRWLE